MLAARDLGGGHGHDRAGNVAVAPARHVTTSGIHRDCLLPGDHAGHDFEFDIRKGAFLRLGKAAHVVMGEVDILLQFLRHQCSSSFDFFFRQDDVAVVLIELGRVFHGLRIAALFDVVEDRANGFPHIGGVGLRGQGGFFQILSGHWTILFWSRTAVV